MMEKNISIVFMPDYLLAAMEPNRHKFIRLMSDENNEKFGLYFLVEPVNENIDYSCSHKDPFLAGARDYFGDIYKNILANSTFGINKTGFDFLFTPVLRRITGKFYDSLSQLSGIDHNDGSPIIVNTVMHPSVIEKGLTEPLKIALKNCFQRSNLQLLFSPLSLHQLLITFFNRSGQLSPVNSNLLIIDGLTDDLHLTAISCTRDGLFNTIGEEIIKNDGLDPREHIVSNLIIRDFDSYYGFNLTEDLRNEYIKKFSGQAKSIIKQMSESQNILESFQTTIVHNGTEYTSTRTFQRRDLEEQVVKYVYRLRNNFDQFISRSRLTYQQIGKILLLGDNLNISEVKSQIQFESQKVMYLTSDEVYTALLKQLITSPVSNVVSNKDEPSQASSEAVYESSRLKTGDEIILGWIAGDGSYRELTTLYAGNNLFTVRDGKNTKGLTPGMTFSTSRLEINRENNLIVTGKGKFSTGILTVLKKSN